MEHPGVSWIVCRDETSRSAQSSQHRRNRRGGPGSAALSAVAQAAANFARYRSRSKAISAPWVDDLAVDVQDQGAERLISELAGPLKALLAD